MVGRPGGTALGHGENAMGVSFGIQIAAVLLAFLAASCARENSTKAAAPTQPAAVRVAAIRVQPRPFASTVSITGTLVSRSAVTVKAETTGRVVRIAKEEGDRVAAGEAVVFVDDSHEKLALRQAESTVQVALVALERARVLESHTRAEWTRAQNLLKSGGITDRDYKSAEIATRDAASQIALCTAQIEQAQAQVEAAKKMLHDSVVRSPVSGEVQAKMTAEGAYVEPPTPVFSVVDNTQLEVEAMIPAANLGAIRSGQPVKFSVSTWPGQEFEGLVIEIGPAVQADTRSGKVRIRAANQTGRLKAGMFVQGEIVTGARREGILVPAEAAYRDDRSAKTAYVFVLGNGRAVRRDVVIGLERDTMLEIVSGLNAGEVVAAEQSIELADGVPVQPQLKEQG
jgi:RND family efflux transporter MFP subunit